MNAHMLRLALVGVLLTLFILSLSWFTYGNLRAGMTPPQVVIQQNKTTKSV